MFYLTTHSTHFYLRLYGVRHMVKDHSDSEKGIPLPPHRLLLSINSKVVVFYAPSHRQDNTYHGLCYTSRGALAGTRNSSMGPPHEGSIHRTMSECSISELRPAPLQDTVNRSSLLKPSGTAEVLEHFLLRGSSKGKERQHLNFYHVYPLHFMILNI